jgi:transcriptional regulator with XRE-family HTH domain
LYSQHFEHRRWEGILSIDLGNRLRFVRTQHGLSQRQLAKRTGVTNSTISLIESNQSNPSVGALKRILDGIPIGLAEFFAIEPQISKQAFYQAEELVEIGRGRFPTVRSVTICWDVRCRY